MRDRASRPDLHDRRTVIGDGLSAVGIDHQQVAAIGTEGRLDGGLDSQAGVDVGDNLALALRRVGSCATTDWSIEGSSGYGKGKV